MYRIRREVIGSFIPLLLLFGAFGLVCFGVPSVLPLRTDPHWPLVALVSVSPGTTSDVLSSVPGLLNVSVAAFQCVVLVEVVRFFWIARHVMTPMRFLLTLSYEAALVVDMFRLWGRDWFVWTRYQLRLGELCSATTPCFPVSGAMPWLSLALLGLVLASLLVDRVVKLRT